jgi:tripartite-type tricarboxylate transporter receptor subunit TctC
MGIPTWTGVALLALAAPSVAAQTGAPDAGQTYPSRPIRMIIPFTGGSATDILARAIGPKMVESWGQQIVVDNRPGAGGTVAGEIVARAAPDGHTLMLTSSALAGSAALFPRLPYDTIRDFAGITQIASTPLVLVVSPTLGVKSVKELIVLARKTPGKINFASAGIGSGTHYAGELFKVAAKIDVVHVPYKGTPEALTDTMAGRVHYMLAPPLTALPLVKGGRLPALAVTTAQRLPLLPDLPTIAETGLTGFEYDGWFGVFAPARIARGIVNRLNAEIGRILKLSDVRERILSLGATPKSSTPEALGTLVRAEIETRRKVFAAAGARAE